MSGFRTYTLGRTSPLTVLLIFTLLIISFYWLTRGLFALLAWAFPVIMIATAVINYRVILGYGQWIWDTFKRNPLFGIGISFITVIAHPFVGLYLLFRAINSKSGGQTSSPRLKGDYIQYEELDEDFLDLSEIKQSKKDINDKYNDLF